MSYRYLTFNTRFLFLVRRYRRCCFQEMKLIFGRTSESLMLIGSVLGFLFPVGTGESGVETHDP